MESLLLNIDGTLVGGDKAYIVAEIGQNHGGDIERCKQLFKAAKECGVDAVKIQKRFNKEIFTEAFYNSPYANENSYAKTYGEHREAVEFNFEQYRELRDYCQALGITFFATAFDFKSVDFLERLGVSCHKISSFDLLNTPLQKYIAQTGKPVILSTGGGSYEDVQRAYDTIMPINPNLVIMQATSSYPTEPKDMHLLVLREYARMFPNVVLGLSDHFIGKVFGPPAYVLGARVFEKHFTIHRWWKGTDQSFSLEPADMAKYVRDIDNIRQAMNDEKKLFECEMPALYKMGKKIVASRNMSVGEILTASDVKIVSPNDGLPPYELERLVGKRVIREIAEKGNITWESIE